MLTITNAQLDAWMLAWVFPMARVLALVMTAPLFSSRAMPARTRLTIGLAISFAIGSALPPIANAPAPGGYAGIGLFIQQIVIGVAMGLTLRIVITAVDFAGAIIGLQMGLSFATFFDPDTSAQTAVIGEWLGLLSSLTFLALNGHLLVIHVLAASFELAPIGGAMLTGKAWAIAAQIGAVVFSAGVMLSLPVVAALLITNVSLAILTRTAPQLNILSLGFPITSTVGYSVLILALGNLSASFQSLFDTGLKLTGVVVRAFGGL